MKLEFKNLTKTYGEQLILNHLDLSVDNATSIGIIGASGCGKSTLLRLISGIENPNSGEININELSPINHKKQLQSKIGYVFQKHNLFPNLSVKNNMMLILEKIKKVDKHEATQRVTSLLKQLQLENEADKKPHQISGGQAQRAAIARALCTNPEILILDEPTAALDPLLTNEVLSSVKNLKELGREFIFVTHEMKFLSEFADFIIFMQDGKIIESGGIEIFNSPKSQELKQFLFHEIKA